MGFNADRNGSPYTPENPLPLGVGSVNYEAYDIAEHGKIMSLEFQISKSEAPTPQALIPEASATPAPQKKKPDESVDLRKAMDFLKKEKFNYYHLDQIYLHAKGDIDLIRQAYEYVQWQPKVENRIGLLLHMIAHPEKICPQPQKEPAKNRFNNFEGRKNDYTEWERLELEHLKAEVGM